MLNDLFEAVQKAYPNVVSISSSGGAVEIEAVEALDANGNRVALDPALVNAAAAEVAAEKARRAVEMKAADNFRALIERRVARLVKAGDELGAIRLRLNP